MTVDQMQQGDYLPDGVGGFLRLSGAEGLLQEALFRLNCRRGAFPLLPALGSRLYTLRRERPAELAVLARLYAQEALLELGIQVQSAEVTVLGDVLQVHFALQASDLNAEAEVRV